MLHACEADSVVRGLQRPPGRAGQQPLFSSSSLPSSDYHLPFRLPTLAPALNDVRRSHRPLCRPPGLLHLGRQPLEGRRPRRWWCVLAFFFRSPRKPLVAPVEAIGPVERAGLGRPTLLARSSIGAQYSRRDSRSVGLLSTIL